MADEISIQPQPRAWLASSVLEPYVSAYGEHLQRGRYAPNTRRVYLCCVAHFACWLTAERYILSAINEIAISRFVSEHLPDCQCPYPARRVAYEIRARPLPFDASATGERRDLQRSVSRGPRPERTGSI